MHHLSVFLLSVYHLNFEDNKQLFSGFFFLNNREKKLLLIEKFIYLSSNNNIDLPCQLEVCALLRINSRTMLRVRISLKLQPSSNQSGAIYPAAINRNHAILRHKTKFEAFKMF